MARATGESIGSGRHWRPPDAGRASNVQWRIVDHRFQNEEGTGLTHSRQGDELSSMDVVEIRNIADPNLQKIIEIASDEVAIKHKLQFRNCFLEGAEALRRRSIENHSDHHQGAAINFLRSHERANARYVALLKEPLDAPMACRRAYGDEVSEIGVRQPTVFLQMTQYLQIGTVES
jgi:hypothetical protein